MKKLNVVELKKLARVSGWLTLILWPLASILHTILMGVSGAYVNNYLVWASEGGGYFAAPLLLELMPFGTLFFFAWIVLRIWVFVANRQAKKMPAVTVEGA